MSDPRWEKLWDIFHQVSELSPGERAEALDRACGNDTELRVELNRLLQARDQQSPLDRQPDALFDLAASLEGRVIGPWRLGDELGRGGMGAVYRGFRDDGTYQQDVAVKFIARHTSERARRHFDTERELLARLDHPGIARLIDAGETNDGLPYLVMEMVNGQPCRQWWETHQPTIQQRLKLMLEICSSVQFAHQNRVIHRDLKASNVMVTHGGQPKLLDFGIARPTDAGTGGTLTQHAMTPDCASPEQVQGLPVTTVSDVYALGVLLFHMLSGKPPYQLSDAAMADVVDVICHRQPPPVSHCAAAADRDALTGDLDAIVARAMAKDPRRRYGSAQELADDIQRHLDRQPVQARRPSRLYQMGRFVRRHQLAVSLSGLAAAALLALSTSLYVQGRQLSDALNQAEAQTRRSEAAFDFLSGLLLQADPETNQGQPLTIAQVLDQGAQQLVEEFASQPLLQVELANTVGQIYLNQGELAAAERFFQQAVDASPRLDQQADAAPGLAGLALVAEARGDPGSAELLQRQVIDLLRAAGDQPAVARARLRLAALLQEQSRLQDAERELTQALALTGIDPVAQANGRIRLGALRWGQGQIAQAAEQYQQALDTLSQTLGEQHHQTARAHFALASAQHRLGQYAAAGDNYRRSLSIRETIYGNNHPLVARTLVGLSGLHYDAGRSGQSVAPSRRALQILQQLHGADGPPTTLALNNLALALHDLGHFEAARSHHLNALAINRKVHGPVHAKVAANLNNLGLINLDLSQPETALGQFETAESIHRQIYPQQHPALGYSAHFLGRTYLQLDRLEQAHQWLEQAIEARSKLSDGIHPQLADSLIWRSVVRMLQGNPERALADARQALAIRRQVLDRTDWRLAEAKVMTGGWAFAGSPGDQQTHGPLLQQGLKALETIRGAEDWRLAAIRHRLQRVLCQPDMLQQGGDASGICALE